jgi:hypothetical protein
LSRRTTQGVDYLLFLSDYSLKGIRTVGKNQELIDELKLSVKEKHWWWTGSGMDWTPSFPGDPNLGA